MRNKIILVSIMALLVLTGFAVAKRPYVFTKNIALTTTTERDTAQVAKFTPDAIVGSQHNGDLYEDTINSVVMSWTAPNSPTVAMVCDSMVKYINASNQSAVITAYDSTTFYIVRSDQKGLAFTAKADTAQTLAATQGNVRSAALCYKQDTIWLGPTSDDKWNATSMLFTARIYPTADTLGHVGFADTAWMRLYTISDVDGSWFLIDSIASDSIGTGAQSMKRIIKTGMTSGAGSDTLFKGPLALIVKVRDTVTDTAVTSQYPVVIKYDLK
jgi:hypothetical protein